MLARVGTDAEDEQTNTSRYAPGRSAFRNRIIYSHDGAILERPVVKSEASLMDLKVPPSSSSRLRRRCVRQTKPAVRLGRTASDKAPKLVANNGAKSRPNRA